MVARPQYDSCAGSRSIIPDRWIGCRGRPNPALASASGCAATLRLFKRALARKTNLVWGSSSRGTAVVFAGFVGSSTTDRHLGGRDLEQFRRDAGLPHLVVLEGEMLDKLVCV